ncbi:DNA-binding NarL/FixJ family response regulator [Diaminobutyricimonas aerilata]|uniref:DNA-binding NarL/FixJ family response regulator n=1 Tax=Diaminobutyricimonas aerilata TaxID=1162967 RepID=A0A2M9CKT6_9MICO|nr:response regulator transcription factor [Diaminobutyricimonas aerilata]PJJ72504.1 DNA-binding NarL/FixJ family response regulator [Diaminobutyricimonas aerilata]
MTIRIALVDDQDLLRLGFRMVLQAEPDLEVVGEAASGRTALTMVAQARPDVVLMDVRMPDGDGIEATRRIAQDHPDTRVLILTTFDLDEYAFAGLRAGASGFLLKDTRPAELLSAIRAVAAGDAAVSPRVTRRMLELFGDRLQPDTPVVDDRLDALTERERQVLVAMAEGLSNGEIAERFFVSESTVKTHVGRVLAKLALRDRVHAVILAYETGLVRP